MSIHPDIQTLRKRREFRYNRTAIYRRVRANCMRFFLIQMDFGFRSGQPYAGKFCSNCRGKHSTDDCPKLPCFVRHEFDEPSHHKQSDCPYRARVKASKAKAARRRAREVQFLARHNDSEDSFFTDDFSDT